MVFRARNREPSTSITSSGLPGNEASWSTSGVTSQDTLTQPTTATTSFVGTAPSLTEADSGAAMEHVLPEGGAADPHQHYNYHNHDDHNYNPNTGPNGTNHASGHYHKVPASEADFSRWCARNSRFVSDYATPAFAAKVADVANRGVSHLGILNMLNDTTDNATFGQALRILLKFEQYAASTTTVARYPITALGVSVDVPKVFDWYRERLKTIYLPHLIVALSHFSYRDADRTDCQIMPPTISRYPNHAKLLYGHTLVSSSILDACT
ncbi:hypothetical protein MRX96_011963, partial [Rhipicephalus microplus]